MPSPIRVHLVAGGFPPGQHAGHDIDYARFRILQALQQNENVHTTVSSDFTDCHRWIHDAQLLICYVAGPFADDYQTAAIRDWLHAGGRWLALHGSSGGKAERIGRADNRRRLVKMDYHEALGGRFLTHPPIMEMNVAVTDRSHPLTHNLPTTFPVQDEPYMVEIIHPDTQILLRTEDINPPPYVQEIYGEDLAVLADGKSYALGFARQVGDGEVAYIAPGHCHTPLTNVQSSVHENISPDRKPPPRFKGPWETPAYEQLLQNALRWGTGANGSSPPVSAPSLRA